MTSNYNQFVQQQPSGGAYARYGIHAPPSFSVDTYAHMGAPPKLSAVQWEDEKTYCFQVECGGVTVARRKDNNMVNGTKLLNVVGMTRGKRDGILKNESGRVVIKSGSMMLKGVWVPFERATELAKEHRVFDSLYPLFEPNIESFYYSPMLSMSAHPIDIEISASKWPVKAEEPRYPSASFSAPHPNFTTRQDSYSYRSFPTTHNLPPALTLPPISSDMHCSYGVDGIDNRPFYYDEHTPTEKHFPSHDGYQHLGSSGSSFDSYRGNQPFPPIEITRQSSDMEFPHQQYNPVGSFATAPVGYSYFPQQPPTTPVSPTSCAPNTDDSGLNGPSYVGYAPVTGVPPSLSPADAARSRGSLAYHV